jgi:hypothetical protein
VRDAAADPSSRCSLQVVHEVINLPSCRRGGQKDGPRGARGRFDGHGLGKGRRVLNGQGSCGGEGRMSEGEQRRAPISNPFVTSVMLIHDVTLVTNAFRGRGSKGGEVRAGMQVPSSFRTINNGRTKDASSFFSEIHKERSRCAHEEGCLELKARHSNSWLRRWRL